MGMGVLFRGTMIASLILGGCNLIEALNKFEIAEKIEELKRRFNDSEDCLFTLSHRFDVYNEVMNMPLDKDGGVPRYYISDSLKSFFEIYEDIKNKGNREEQPAEHIFTDDFFGTLFTKRYGRQ